MMCILLAAGAAMVLALFVIAAIQASGRASRAEEDAERRRWEEMRHRGGDANRRL